MEAIQYMTLGNIGNAIGISAILFYFLTPSLAVLLCIYVIRRARKRMKDTKEVRKIQKEEKAEDKRMLKSIENEPEIPKDMSKFESLTLEFDETGRVKQ